MDAPYVKDAKVVYECEYVKTVCVESFSIVIGAVKRVSVDRTVLLDEGSVDEASAYYSNGLHGIFLIVACTYCFDRSVASF